MNIRGVKILLRDDENPAFRETFEALGAVVIPHPLRQGVIRVGGHETSWAELRNAIDASGTDYAPHLLPLRGMRCQGGHIIAVGNNGVTVISPAGALSLHAEPEAPNA